METEVATKPVKHVTNITPRDIYKCMTELQVQQLIILREQVSNLQWDAGDLVNSIYEQAMAHRLPCTISHVCQMIADETQGDYSSNTLRIYSAVARFYPIHVRGNFPTCIPFWIYRYATRFEEDYAKVFEWVIDFWDSRGRTPYKREVSQYFEPASGLFRQLQPNPNCPPEAFSDDGGMECRMIEQGSPTVALQAVTGQENDLPALMIDLQNISYRVRVKVNDFPDYKRAIACQLLIIISALLE